MMTNYQNDPPEFLLDLLCNPDKHQSLANLNNTSVSNNKIIDSKWYEFTEHNIGIIKYETKEKGIRFKIGLVVPSKNLCEDENYIIEYGEEFNPEIFRG